MDRYKGLFLATPPSDGDDATYTTILVVFTDTAPERASGLCNDVLGQLAGPAYEDDGIIFGPFYDGNEGTAVYNSDLRPFQSPVPFLFVRYTVISDWKFFLDDLAWPAETMPRPGGPHTAVSRRWRPTSDDPAGRVAARRCP